MKRYSIQRCKPLLGTFVEISLQGDCNEQALLGYSEIAFAEISRLHHLLSFHEPESELSKLNRQLLSPKSSEIALANELVEILSLAQSLFTLSGGQYDLSIAPSLVLDKQLPNHLQLSARQYGNFSNLTFDNNRASTTMPLCLDLGGIAKGYIVDQAIKTLPSELVISINAGGDLYQNNWQSSTVAVQYGKYRFTKKNITMLNCALATSGNYYRKGKSAFIEPKNQKPKNLSGVISVFAPSVMIADALTKVALLLTEQELRPILSIYNAQVIKLSPFGFMKTI